MVGMPGNSVDLVFGSPPYEDARTYGIDFNLKGQQWVDWMVEVFRASSRVCKGLVAFVVQGKTRQYKWSCTPVLLMADLHRVGFNLRRPVIFQRFGVPGSGGKEWLKCNHEYVICVTPPGKLPWSDNIACGHVPVYGPGGPCSNRKKDGSRVNQWGGTGKQTDRRKDGETVNVVKPSHVYFDPVNLPKDFVPPNLCNPGDYLDILDCGVTVNCGAMGKGHMGSNFAHETDAPFPEKLAEFFVKSFCPPGGTVLDPFLGSGTTCAEAKRLGRGYIGIDIRQSQIELTERRLRE
jgi:site-specific DNA-methyltransferase (cytosine-N4-specific)